MRVVGKMPAVAWIVQAGIASAATNATVRWDSRRKSNHSLSREYKPRDGTTAWGANNQTHRAIEAQTQFMGTEMTVRMRNWDGPSPRIIEHSKWETTED